MVIKQYIDNLYIGLLRGERFADVVEFADCYGDCSIWWSGKVNIMEVDGVLYVPLNNNNYVELAEKNYSKIFEHYAFSV